MNELFLFVRPPRPLWPFNGPGTAFWPPLAFASMAAALRGGITGLRVAILDAPALKMGWKTLSSEIRRLKPSYVGIGEEAVSCVEGLRLASIGKASGATVIAGGCFFGNVAQQILSTKLVDVVVHGEGEQTIVELVQTLRSGDKHTLRRVRGITFSDGDDAVFTGWREPLADLDSLPFPAYDLLPIQNYGTGSRNHPDLVSIELSRGCTHQCEFCVLWRQMSRYPATSPVACLRTKSPERVFEEIRICTERYGRRYLGWVDPCFNADPKVPQRVSELLLSSGIKVGQSAWVRADYLRRDIETGALDTCTRAGLNELYIGIERSDSDDLSRLNKRLNHSDVAEALETIATRYPHVCTVGSFIYGVPGETRDSLRSLFRFGCGLPLDMALFIPLTPLPGTPFWKPELWDASGGLFRDLDFLPHGNADAWSRGDLHSMLLRCFVLYWPLARIRTVLRGLSVRDLRRRRIVRNYLKRSALFALRAFANQEHRMQIPDWYQS